jgi:hypothetical protein
MATEVKQTPAAEPETGGATPETTQEAGVAAEQQTPEKKGDLTAALRQERATVKQLKERLTKLTTKKPGSESAEIQLDFSKFAISEDDLIDGNAEAINTKIRQAVATAVTQVQQRTAGQLAELSNSQQVERLVAKHAIFADADQELAGDAMAAASAAIGSLPEGSGLEDVEMALAQVARRYSRYKVERQPADPDGDSPLPVGSGTAAAAHLKSEAPRPRNRQEAVSLSARLARKFATSKGLRYD